jgi:hypothetical protein
VMKAVAETVVLRLKSQRMYEEYIERRDMEIFSRVVRVRSRWVSCIDVESLNSAAY